MKVSTNLEVPTKGQEGFSRPIEGVTKNNQKFNCRLDETIKK